MSILIEKDKLFDPNGSLIDEDGKFYLVSDIIEDGDFLFSNIPVRSLILLLCQNKFDSAFIYINCLERGIVPILIDSESDISLVNTIINQYEPNYILCPSSKDNKFENYVGEKYFKNYTVYVRNENSSIVLHSKLSLLLSTSGTTGSPKLVRLTYNNLVSNASSIAEYLNLNSTDRAISNLPMNYSFGLSIINSHLHVGGAVLMTSESITQRRFWNLFKEFKITSLSGVPYTFEIFKKFRLLNIELPSLKTITQAGGKLSNDLIEHFAQLADSKGVKFFVMYGQTEGTARLSYLPPDFLFKKLGSIGRAIPRGNFHIINEQGNIIDQPGVSGELIYSGPNVMLGYADNKQDLSLGDKNKNILHTGDIAYFDLNGFFYIVGRIKRFIKLLGNRVNLDELEMLLIDIGVKSACTGKDNLLAVYILDEDKKGIVKEFLTQKLGIHFSIFSIKVVEEIPKNASGKILYSKLQVEI